MGMLQYIDNVLWATVTGWPWCLSVQCGTVPRHGTGDAVGGHHSHVSRTHHQTHCCFLQCHHHGISAHHHPPTNRVDLIQDTDDDNDLMMTRVNYCCHVSWQPGLHWTADLTTTADRHRLRHDDYDTQTQTMSWRLRHTYTDHVMTTHVMSTTTHRHRPRHDDYDTDTDHVMTTTTHRQYRHHVCDNKSSS